MVKIKRRQTGKALRLMHDILEARKIIEEYKMKSRLVITAEQKYKVFEETIDSVAIQMVAAFLYKQHLKGYGKKRIQREFEEIMSILECPEIFGKSLEGLEIVEMMTTKYGINFDRVILKHESLEEWTKSYKEAQKNVR